MQFILLIKQLLSLKHGNAPDEQDVAERFYGIMKKGVRLFAVMVAHLKQFNVCFRNAVHKTVG